MRWVLFALLIWTGAEGAGWLSARLGELFWLPWVMFALWWIPMALDLSHRVLRLPRVLIRIETFEPGRKGRPAALRGGRLRCPHCGGWVEEERAICPHCYEDLKVNCQGCGRIIEAGSAQGLCDECRREGRSRSPAEGME